MTTNIPRIYVYKITFYEVPHYYYGLHKEKIFNEYYMGSPVTHKDFWELYTPKKEYIEFFEYSDDGYNKAGELETSLIRRVYNKDPFCLNENCGGIISLDICSKAGKIGGAIAGKKAYELGLGIFSLPKERKIEISKNNGKRAYENGIGYFSLTPEEKSENGKRVYEKGLGFHSFTTEQRIEIGKQLYEDKKGIHALTVEDKREIVKIVNSQMWKCTITGYVSTPGSLTKYQNKRGISISNRVRFYGTIYWKISYANGEEITVTGSLSEWAKENGYIYNSLLLVSYGNTLNHRGIIKVEKQCIE